MKGKMGEAAKLIMGVIGYDWVSGRTLSGKTGLKPQKIGITVYWDLDGLVESCLGCPEVKVTRNNVPRFDRVKYYRLKRRF